MRRVWSNDCNDDSNQQNNFNENKTENENVNDNDNDNNRAVLMWPLNNSCKDNGYTYRKPAIVAEL